MNKNSKEIVITVGFTVILTAGMLLYFFSVWFDRMFVSVDSLNTHIDSGHSKVMAELHKMDKKLDDRKRSIKD